MNVINLLYIPLIFFLSIHVLVLGYGNILQIFYDLLFPLSLTNETDTTLNSIILNIFMVFKSIMVHIYLTSSLLYTTLFPVIDHYK